MKTVSPFWKHFLKTWLVIGGVAYLVRLAYVMSGQLDWGAIRARPGVFGIIVVLLTANLVSQFLSWLWIVRRGATTLSLVEGYRSFSAALLSRYLPAGKLFQFVGMHQFTVNPADRVNATYSLMQLTLVTLIAGFIAALPGVGLIVHRPLIFIFGGTILLVAGLGVYQRWGGRILRKFSSRFAAIDESQRMGVSMFATLLAANVFFSWGFFSISGLLSLSLIGVSPSWNDLPFVLSSHFLAFLGGAAAVVVPAGLGVRDGIFIALLKVRYLPAQAIWMALAVRLFGIFAEMVFVAPFLVQRVRSQNPLRTIGPNKSAGLEKFAESRKLG